MINKKKILFFKKAQYHDLENIVAIHKKAYSKKHFTTLFSEKLLKKYYSIFLDDFSQILIAYEDDQKNLLNSKNPMGFIVYGKKIQEKIDIFKKKNWLSLLKLSIINPIISSRKIYNLLFSWFRRNLYEEKLSDELILSVAVKFTSKGVGKSLLNAALKDANKRDLKDIGLFVNTSNLRAINTYLSQGFQIKHFRNNQYYMEKDLFISRENDFLSFSRPEIGKEEINEVISSLKSGWVTTGPKTKQFENDFASFIGGSVHALAVNSATSGIHLALKALGVKNGDEVITTTHTFTASAAPIVYCGAKPIFVDIDKSTLCIDVEEVRKKISPKTKVIIPVHFAGLSAEMPELIKLAKEKNIKIIEDAAHALPTTCNGKLIGSLDTDVCVFSFYANKTMTTGEGGMVVTKSSEIADKVKKMRLHGIDRDAFNRFTAKKPSWFYEVVYPGFKYNMTDIAASIGIHQLNKVNNFQSRRNEIASIYNEKLQSNKLILPPNPINGDLHSWHLYIIRLSKDFEISRDTFIEEMYKKGIGCGVHYIPLHNQPYWKREYNLTKNMFPISQSVYEKSISLPIYSLMTEEDIKKVVNSVNDILS